MNFTQRRKDAYGSALDTTYVELTTSWRHWLNYVIIEFILKQQEAKNKQKFNSSNFRLKSSNIEWNLQSSN